jgi:predicted RNA-binding protein
MKVKEYKNIEDYIKQKKLKDNLKGITICIAKKCNEALYHNQSTSNPKYCMRCGG